VFAGNFVVSSNGTLYSQFAVDLVTLVGNNSVIGRSLVIWSAQDDCQPSDGTNTFGGAPAAWGVIGVSSQGTTNNTAHSISAESSIYVAQLGPTSNAGVGAGGYVWIQRRNNTGLHQVYVRLWGLTPFSTHG
jgi:hypothetical protein